METIIPCTTGAYARLRTESGNVIDVPVHAWWVSQSGAGTPLVAGTGTAMGMLVPVSHRLAPGQLMGIVPGPPEQPATSNEPARRRKISDAEESVLSDWLKAVDHALALGRSQGMLPNRCASSRQVMRNAGIDSEWLANSALMYADAVYLAEQRAAAEVTA